MPQPQVASHTGLITPDSAPVPLIGVAVSADIEGLAARVTVTQRYVNHETSAIEAVYLFPLDEGAAVCGFEALINGAHVVGQVMPRDKAFETYDDALRAGHGAYLLDEERADVFQASVGNLPPGAEAVLRITYVTELAVSDGTLRFALPTTISPRYAPATDRVGIGQSTADTLNPPRDWQVPYGLDLSIRVTMPGAITGVESPSHPVSVAFDGGSTVVRLSQPQAPLDRDFVLSISGGGLDVPRAWSERTSGDEQAIAIGFVPTLPAIASPAEIVFVVDRSGSMGGTSIGEVRDALQLCLRSMIAGCRFNIVGFGTSVESLFPESQPYNETSLAAASRHVSALEANLGGTEILAPLQQVLSAARGELRRQVIVLTDGQVTNTDDVLALVKANAATARVFALGIGHGASRHLVNGIARAGGGTAEFITPGERIEPKVVALCSRLLSPSYTDVRIDWGGLNVVTPPDGPGPMFAGTRMIAYAFAREPKPATIRLSATGPSGPVTFDVAFDPAAATDGATVSTLAARARIRALEESPDWLASRGSQQRRPRTDSTAREIVDLAVRYGLASRETSFVAVEQRTTGASSEPLTLRRVPIAVTHGWGQPARAAGVMRMVGGPLPPPQAMPASLQDTGAIGADVASLEQAMPMARRVDARVDTSALGSALRWARSRIPGTASPRPPVDDAAKRLRRAMIALVELQHADGSWDLDDRLARAIGARDVRALESGMGAQRGDPNARRAWATALAIGWLRARAVDVSDEWRLIADKGIGWLTAVAPPLAGAGDWMEHATRWHEATPVP